MRVSTKVSLSLSLVGLIVFGGLGSWQLAAEKRDLERTMLKEVTTLARATAESVRQDLGERDPDEAKALLQSLEGFDARLDAVLWRGDGASSHAGQLALLVDEVGRGATEHGRLATRIVSPDRGQRLALVAAPIDASRAVGAVVLIRPLDDVDADLWREAGVIALSVVSFSALAGLLGFALGEVYIARPLARLDHAMAVVGAGDFDVPPLAGRTDEVGRALQRFDSMRSELQHARRQLQDEQEDHRVTRERLADADRLVTIGQLAAGLAHEIGSPLQILRARAEKLQDRAGADATLVASAKIIADQAQRITRIVGQLLEFARSPTRERRATDPEACVRAVVDLLELEARRGGVSVELAAGTLPTVTLDPDALQQIVFNLVRNALAATEAGGRVRIGLERVAEDSPARESLRLVVADDGRGMNEEVRARAFEPFFTTRPRDGGIGLGLPVVQSLVETMNGSIEIEASDGHGTTIVVSLPC